MIERGGPDLPVRLQADLLRLSRTSLYYRPTLPSSEEVALKHRIDEIFTERPFYGSRKIAAVLRREGKEINRKAVQRHMRGMGIAAICPGPNLSRRNADHSVYPYLLRDRTVTRVNEVWGIDTTSIRSETRLEPSWMYLVALLDWHSRYVVSWELDQTLELPFVLAANGVQVSMDGKKRALDNIFTRRLWQTVKYEEVYLKSYGSPKVARCELARYLGFYNEERPHQALGHRTPKEVFLNPSSPL
jgi:putative transposase